MSNNDWHASLKAFLDSNPDLPQGEEIHDETAVEKPFSQPRLDIFLDRKGRAGKTATIITGFVSGDDEVAKVASLMKSSLATGGSARGGEILIQGDRCDDVLKFLLTHGYKARIV